MDKIHQNENTAPDNASSALQPRREGEERCHLRSSFVGWEWLKLPGVLLAMIGLAGVLSVYGQTFVRLLESFKFPPLWSCFVLLGGGMVLLLISATAHTVRYQQSAEMGERKNWRSF